MTFFMEARVGGVSVSDANFWARHTRGRPDVEASPFRTPLAVLSHCVDASSRVEQMKISRQSAQVRILFDGGDSDMRLSRLLVEETGDNGQAQRD